MKINYSRLFLVNYLYLLILEFSFKMFVLQTYDIGFMYIIICSLPIALIITFISSLFKNRNINRIISIIIWFILYFIFVAETIYYSFYKSIFSVSAVTYGGQVMEFFSAVIEHIFSNIYLILGTLIPFITLTVLAIINKITFEKYKGKETLVLFFSFIFLHISVLEYKKDEASSSYYLFYQTNDLMQGTNRFGLITSVALDAVKIVAQFEEVIELSKQLPFTKKENVEYNVLDIDFDTLIEKEKDNTVKTMHNYFNTSDITEKNKYTGLFTGKNLVFITAEAFYPIGVDEKYTPTLYKMVNEGFVFENFYQPIYNCSTSDGEFINNLSILPGVSTCSMNETSNKYLPFTVGNLFDDYGYNTYAFHGWTYSYYGRHKTHTNMGYKYYGYDRYKRGYKYALKGIKDTWPTSDIDVVNSSYDIFKDDERFVAYYISISGHLAYNFTGGNYISSKNKNLVSDMDASTAIKAYMATQIEFDRSLELLMDKLEADGKLEDTVFIIVSDHYPYGLSNKEIKDYADWVKNVNFDLYKSNLIIYNTELTPEVVDKYVGSLDVLPTILNLFGVEYDSRLLMGRDIFSSSEDLVIFNNKSWITEKGRYDYLKKTFESFTDEEVSDEYIAEINEKVNLKFQMSKLLISKNYYKKILGG